MVIILKLLCEQRANDVTEMPVLTTPTNPNDLSSHERDERASAVRQRQEMLASAFRDLMTRYQSLE
jgi:hypothetical protein